MTATLLLADDSVTIQRVIELTFADEDVRVVAVSDGDQAIARVEQDPPDIVLADVGMPGKSGYEVAGYIKRSPRLAHIPVLLLTGAFEPVDQLKASEAGCDGVLAKPFEPQLVISRVKELLARRGTAGAAPLPAPPAAKIAEARTPAPPDAPEPVPVVDSAPAAGSARPSTSLSEYFDQLDEAFAKLPAARTDVQERPISQPSIEEPDHLPGPRTETRLEAAGDFWDLTVPGSIEPEVPVSYASSEAALGRPAAPPPQAPAAPPLSLPLPALADAFAALLAAEQNPSAAPAPGVAWSPPPPPITDEALERIVQRVLERMSADAVRARVEDIVTSVAERMVREEIERIKASIK